MPCDTLWRSALSPSPRLRLILPPACRDAGVHQPPSHRAGAASSTGRSSQDLSVPRGPLWLLRPTFVLRMADLARRVHAPSLPSSVGPRAAAYPRFYQSNATLWRAAASPSPPRFFFCVPAGLPRRPRQPTTPPPAGERQYLSRKAGHPRSVLLRSVAAPLPPFNSCLAAGLPRHPPASTPPP